MIGTTPRAMDSRRLAVDRPAAQSDGESVVTMDERHINVELVRQPQPEAMVSGEVGRGDQACEGIGRTAAIIVNVHHDTAWCGPDANRRRWLTVQQCVADRLGGADQQVVKRRVRDAAATNQRKRAPRLSWRAPGELDDRCRLLKRVRRGGNPLEMRGILVTAAALAIA